MLREVSSAPMSKIIDSPPSPPTPEESFFYHCIDLPGLGLMEGQWDLRDSVGVYLGDVDFAERRVLEVGPANGFLTFWMEKHGAEVVGLELDSGRHWDLVPFADFDYSEYLAERDELQSRLQNAFWLAHRAVGSSAGLVHDSIYDVSETLGSFDVATFGMVLLHVRDPLQAMRSVLSRTRRTAIVTEIFPAEEMKAFGIDFPMRFEIQSADGRVDLGDEVVERIDRVPPAMYLQPRSETMAPKETWWRFTPSLIRQFLAVLGFDQQRVLYHYQPHDSRYQFHRPENSSRVFHPCFTVVAERH